MGKYLIKKPDKYIFLFIILISARGLGLSAQSEEELFESVFGTVEEREQTIEVPLYLNGRYKGNLNLHIDPLSSSIEAEAPELIELLRADIQSSILEILNLSIDGDRDTISLEALADNGIMADFNYADLTLRIEIPPTLQDEMIVDLSERSATSMGIALKPSPYSAYLNMFSSLNLNISGNDSNRETLMPVSIGLDSAVNMKSLVLEGDILFNYGTSFNITDWHIRFVKDDPERNVTMKAGTISYPVTRLQGFMPLNGISISRNFGLNPYENTQPLARQSLILNTRSEIEIIVNGRLQKKIELPGGRYDLTNLPLDGGANLVEIHITDISGRDESIVFTQPFNINLLKKGISDYAVAVGLHETRIEKPLFSAYYKHGLTDRLTFGANIQSDLDLFNAGLSLLGATGIGTFSLESSLSYDETVDWAASFLYRYSNNQFRWKNNWSLSADFRSDDYSGISLEKTANSTPLRLGFYYGQILPGDISMGVNISRSFTDNWEGGRTGLGLHLSRHFGTGVLMNLFANGDRDDNGETDFSAGLTATINLQKRNETLSTTANWPGTAVESSWQKSSESRVPGYTLNAGLSGIPAGIEQTPYGLNLGGEYRGYRFTSSINHNSTFLNTEDLSLHNSSFYFSSALVYADSTFAITRPVLDSFVIVKPVKSFNDFTIGINPEGKSYGAILKKGPYAVLPDLQSYRSNQIFLEAVDLPIGFDLGESAYTFLPGYKSGTVITVGSEATIFAGGYLIGTDGKALTVSAIALRPLMESSAKERLFFTNREGYFELYELTEGDWILELLENRNYRSIITIPAGSTGFYELPDTVLKREDQTND